MIDDVKQTVEENELEEVVPDIELTDKEPPFLIGQTQKAGVTLSPIKIT